MFNQIKPFINNPIRLHAVSKVISGVERAKLTKEKVYDYNLTVE